ncbi:hypothetical protein POM88_038694 [Heracleum sosnowskyi]|uniref:Uncharacterized protein n=1 Tax=Heracleum sosnowskyi TaxID=360622 RepID=A0AAD8HBC4_9APIA|nr:hypothetical protein POM88_038694 [Heracleum sosnowskyi]
MYHLFVASMNRDFFLIFALDGVVNLWQLQARGSTANCLSSTECVSVKQRRWPEDIAWHPHGNSLFSVFSADGGDSQVAVLDLNSRKERSHVNFLDDKPHVKGIINNIMFMPWEDTSRRTDYSHQVESKCMNVVTNPCGFNLFMVQTGTVGKQLRLFDYRVRQLEVHAFGWEQETSESQSALIDQAWSPDGLYITSGSADPVIHIFYIRYNAKKPSQSIKAHQKRVFKALWHRTFPLLISISSDLNIGLHKIYHISSSALSAFSV